MLSVSMAKSHCTCVNKGICTLQLIEGTKGKRHRLVSIVNNMQTAESLKMQSVMLGGKADPSAFMTEVGPFPYDAFRVQEANSPGRRASKELLPQLSLPQVSHALGFTVRHCLCVISYFRQQILCHVQQAPLSIQIGRMAEWLKPLVC